MERIGDVRVPDVLTCWTVQRAEAWANGERRGVYREDGRTWPPEYRWFRDRLRERVPGSGGRFPVWASLTRPDLRQGGLERRGAQCVRVAFRVPRERAVLVDRAGVFTVLNRCFFSWTEAEDVAWEKRIGTRHSFEALNASQRREVEESWLRALELRRPKGSRAWIGTLDVDVLVSEVRMADVVRVTPFVAR